jgi:hypothetical protein
MKQMIPTLLFVCALCACSSSDEDESKDMTYPEISVEGIVASPINCETYHRGEVIPFEYVFTDNQELGSYNIEIHQNFEHHTHSTDAEECPMDHVKEPVKPWIYNQDFSIPAGLRSYKARHDIQIPADIDTGDYHFMIRLTDHAGWQQLHAVTIKIAE